MTPACPLYCVALTATQLKIAQLDCQGLSAGQIAVVLGNTPEGVRQQKFRAAGRWGVPWKRLVSLLVKEGSIDPNAESKSQT